METVIRRYTTLFNDNRIKQETLFYGDVVGMTWEECKEKYLGEDKNGKIMNIFNFVEQKDKDKEYKYKVYGLSNGKYTHKKRIYERC